MANDLAIEPFLPRYGAADHSASRDIVRHLDLREGGAQIIAQARRTCITANHDRKIRAIDLLGKLCGKD